LEPDGFKLWVKMDSRTCTVLPHRVDDVQRAQHLV
jgi:hypothetical protein